MTPEQQEGVVRWEGQLRVGLPEGGSVVMVFETRGETGTDSFWFGFLVSDLPQKYWRVDFKKWRGAQGVPCGTRRLRIPTVTQSAEGHTVRYDERDVRMLKAVEPILNE